jgi:hypothetical protein
MSDYKSKLTTTVNSPYNWRSIGHFLVEQTDPFVHVVTSLAVRRVVPSGGSEELQISVEIVKQGKRRTTTTFGSLILTPEIADKLAEACAELRLPDGTRALADHLLA